MEKDFFIKYPMRETTPGKVIFSSSIDLLSEALFEGPARRLFIIDENVYQLSITQSLIKKIGAVSAAVRENVSESAFQTREKYLFMIIPSGEQFKTMETVLSIIDVATKALFNRYDEFVAVGGGVACDLAAFAASIYKRGVPVLFIPTTLLAMVDAAIGGKCGCDNRSLKNMIGSFHPAKRLFYCPNFLLTLPNEEYLSGLAEAIKTALLYDADLLTILFDKKDSVLSREDAVLGEIILRCAKAKASVVERDFLEKGERKFLNLGHTFAHALEKYFLDSGRPVTHGGAVAWGVMRAAALSNLLGLSKADYKEKIESLLTLYGYDTRPYAGVVDEDFVKKIIRAMHKDKKNSSDRVTFVLQRDVLDTLIKEVDDDTIEKVFQ